MSFEKLKEIEKHNDIKKVSLCNDRVTISFKNGITFFPLSRIDKINEYVKKYKS